MIDVHCHLEQRDYDSDRDEVIERCRRELKAVVTSCAHPKDFDLTMKLVEANRGFVFATAGFHPEYVKDIDERQKAEYLQKIRDNRRSLVGIGEVGLDYSWVTDPAMQEESRALFREMIALANELRLPIVVHSREAHEDTLSILEDAGARRVLLHMWGGHQLMDRVNGDEFCVSANAIVMRSKSYRKVVKAVPMERLMLETDSPWLGVRKVADGYEIDPEARNEPTTIKLVAQKIAELKGVPFEGLWEQCCTNAVLFFDLRI